MMIGFGRDRELLIVIGRCRVVGLIFNLGFAGHN